MFGLRASCSARTRHVKPRHQRKSANGSIGRAFVRGYGPDFHPEDLREWKSP